MRAEKVASITITTFDTAPSLDFCSVLAQTPMRPWIPVVNEALCGLVMVL